MVFHFGFGRPDLLPGRRWSLSFLGKALLYKVDFENWRKYDVRKQMAVFPSIIQTIKLSDL